jgi:hypothetical protein
MRDHDLDVIEAETEAEAAWMDRLREEAHRTLVPLADSWFTGANVPGKLRQVLVFIGHFGRYRKIVDDVGEHGYDGFAFRTRWIRSMTEPLTLNTGLIRTSDRRANKEKLVSRTATDGGKSATT